MLRLATALLVSAIVLTVLSIPLGPLPPLGKLLDPRGGFWTVADQAFPTGHQTLTFPGLEQPVQVFRDPHGIPHVFAEADEDLFRAVGYLHASDRLFQMDLQRRAARGMLAEVFGASFLETDVFLRTIGLPWAAETSLAATDSETRAGLQAYADGVNQLIAEVSPLDLPLEFKLLNYEPRPWEPLDSLAFAKLLGWQLSGSFADLSLQRIEDGLGAAAMAELFPVDMPFPLPIIPSGGQPAPPAPRVSPSAAPTLSPDGVRGLLRAFDRVASFLGSLEAVGSNNWVVRGTRTAGGGALLANDPHLSLSLPSLWYMQRLRSPSFNVYGVALLAAPLPILGYNERIAWGFTNTGADVLDFFVETVNPQNTSQYLFQNQWLPFTVRQEVVAVQGSGDFTFDLRISHHGPVVSDLPQAAGMPETLAMQWTGHGPTQEFRAFLGINQAGTWAEFRAALEDFHVPAQNVVYADVDGNIGIVVNGLFPIRKAGLGRLPVEGSAGDFEWTSTIPFTEVPAAFNPVQGYLVSANQLPSLTSPHYLGWAWEDRYRAGRINEVLATNDRVDIEATTALQLDHVEIAAREFLPFLLDAFDALGDRGASLHPLAPAALDLLQVWDHRMDIVAVSPTLYATWREAYRAAAFGDEWRAGGVEGVSLIPSVTILENLTKNHPASPWFDDVETAAQESRDDILRRALVDTLNLLESALGGDMASWQWGEYHQLQLQHPTGLDSLSSAVVPRPGGRFTVDVATGSPRDGRLLVTSGPSWRLLVDFSRPLGTGPQMYGIYPGGQSSNPLHPHHQDLFAMWRSGEYVELALTAPTDFQAAAAPRG